MCLAGLDRHQLTTPYAGKNPGGRFSLRPPAGYAYNGAQHTRTGEGENMAIRMTFSLAIALSGLWLPASGSAGDIIQTRQMTMELAADIARAAVDACGEKGYQVSAVVVDRGANVQVVMRDTLASRFTIDIARDKANAAMLAGTDTGTLRANREDIRQELNHVDGILVLRGGLPITVAGSTVGAVGVSGAPGADIDEACAAAGMESVSERLEFAD